MYPRNARPLPPPPMLPRMCALHPHPLRSELGPGRHTSCERTCRPPRTALPTFLAKCNHMGAVPATSPRWPPETPVRPSERSMLGSGCARVAESWPGTCAIRTCATHSPCVHRSPRRPRVNQVYKCSLPPGPPPALDQRPPPPAAPRMRLVRCGTAGAVPTGRARPPPPPIPPPHRHCRIAIAIAIATAIVSRPPPPSPPQVPSFPQLPPPKSPPTPPPPSSPLSAALRLRASAFAL